MGAAYAVEHNESLEHMIQKYEIPYILDAMSPIRQGIRTLGFGRPSSEDTVAPDSEENANDQLHVDPYAIEEEHKDLHDEALEELADDLRHDLGGLDETDTPIDVSVVPEEEPEVDALVDDSLAQIEQKEVAKQEDYVEEEIEPLPTPLLETSNDDATPLPIVEEAESQTSVPDVQVEVPSAPSSKSQLLEVRQNALEEVLDGMAKQTAALRDETERSLVHDLDGLDEKALRYRVAQLSTEFFERIKWEGLRQQQALQQAEAVLAQKYSDLLSQQEHALQLDSERKLFELEKTLRQESNNEVQSFQVAQETRVHNALTKQEEELGTQFATNLEMEKSALAKSMDEQHTLEVAMMKETHVKQMLETQKEVKAINADISALHKVVDSEFGKTTVSASTHALAAAVLMAEDVLVQSAPAGKAIAALQKLATAEPLVAAVVQTLPVGAARKGVPVLDDIKLRFVVVREEARKAALAPEGTNPILSQMIGNFLSFVSIKPTGNVEGDSVEAALSRIDYYLERNKLDMALQETKSIRGYPRTLMSDWERMVHDRLVVDQAIRSLKTVSALRHLELS